MDLQAKTQSNQVPIPSGVAQKLVYDVSTNKLYTFRHIPNGTDFVIATIDPTTGVVSYVASTFNSTDRLSGLAIIDTAFDPANSLMLGNFLTNDLMIFNASSGHYIKSVSISGRLGPVAFEPICICCIQSNSSNSTQSHRYSLYESVFSTQALPPLDPKVVTQKCASSAFTVAHNFGLLAILVVTWFLFYFL